MIVLSVGERVFSTLLGLHSQDINLLCPKRIVQIHKNQNLNGLHFPHYLKQTNKAFTSVPLHIRAAVVFSLDELILIDIRLSRM